MHLEQLKATLKEVLGKLILYEELRSSKLQNCHNKLEYFGGSSNLVRLAVIQTPKETYQLKLVWKHHQ